MVITTKIGFDHLVTEILLPFRILDLGEQANFWCHPVSNIAEPDEHVPSCD